MTHWVLMYMILTTDAHGHESQMPYKQAAPSHKACLQMKADLRFLEIPGRRAIGPAVCVERLRDTRGPLTMLI